MGAWKREKKSPDLLQKNHDQLEAALLKQIYDRVNEKIDETELANLNIPRNPQFLGEKKLKFIRNHVPLEKMENWMNSQKLFVTTCKRLFQSFQRLLLMN